MRYEPSLDSTMHNVDTIEQALQLAGADTPVHAASDIKNHWSRIVESAVRHGEVIVTRHRRPEVVVMDVGAYADLVRRAGAAGPLNALQADFDRRFTALNTQSGDRKLGAVAAAGIPPSRRTRKKATAHK